MFKFLTRCRNSIPNKGTMMVEAAMILPFLLLIMVGGVETARYVTLHQKMERASVTLSDLVARATSMTTSELNDVFFATTTIMSPYPMGSDGIVYISSVTKPVGAPALVTWQRSGSGSFGGASRIGSQGGNASLPAGFTLQDNESVIVAEVLYRYRPMFMESAFVEDTLYQRALFRPRLSTSVTIN